MRRGIGFLCPGWGSGFSSSSAEGSVAVVVMGGGVEGGLFGGKRVVLRLWWRTR